MRTRIALVAVSLLAAGWLTVAFAESPQEEAATAAPKVVVQAVQPVYPATGEHLYTAYCADCHGEKGRGDGKLAALLAKPMPDLGQMAGDDGKFNRGAAQRAIAKKHMMPTEEAKNWQDVLAASFGNERGEKMLGELVRHLESLQVER